MGGSPVPGGLNHPTIAHRGLPNIEVLKSSPVFPPLCGGKPPREAPEKNQVEGTGGLLIDLPSDDSDGEYLRLE